ncbi:flagellar motor protein MotB [Adhaeribacter aerolatus]|uniref:Flagellar motor protein MotB n=1 Tax=Adhaeribacter aerolatus TaxID=670289 RepID=A0A512AWP6_9BACT|nr:OmpA family protein [Adhaeribacter aerolatus]GEO04148.1 flagellar motor protein MotB [Adhaeribacter aerolatus]
MSFLPLRKIFLFLFFTTALASCVTKKKFDDLSARKSKLDLDIAACEKAMARVQAERKSLAAELAELQSTNQKMVKDSTETGVALRKTRKLYAELNGTYDKLIKNHERLMSNSASESTRLSADLARREAELLTSKNQIDKLSADLKTREERLNEMERVLAEKDKAVDNLRNKVSNALLGFKSNDLTVNVKNGKVYVSLSEQLLFKSGSTKVDPKGQEALQKLAQALRDQQEVNVLVEGHTDDVPVSKGTMGMKDNWDLSVLRATEITRILTSAGLTPERVTPSGRSKYVPVAQNTSADQRSLNRRTEIILTPKLDELFQILEKN